MNYQVKQNGLWGDRALPIQSVRFEQMDPQYMRPYNHVPSVEELTEMLEYLDGL